MLYKLYSHTNLSILDHMMTLKILLSARFQNVLISSIWAIYVVQEVEAHQVLKNDEYWEGDNLWLTPKDVTSLNTKMVFDTTRKITDKGLNNFF